MLEYQGKHTKAKVMIDKIEPATVSQIYEMINHEAFTNPVSVMPDCHKGNGSVIGFTMEMGDKIIPNIVGVDIGCGMLSFVVRKGIFAEMDRIEIDILIRTEIPFGTNVQTRKGIFDINDKYFWLELNFDLIKFTRNFNSKYGTTFSYKEMDYRGFIDLCNKIGMDGNRAILSLGTLGGGNHFIEIGKSVETKDYRATIHSGSRQFGLKVCQYHQKIANSFHPTGKDRRGLAFLTEENMFGYLTDMVIAQKYAQKNRELMRDMICNILDTDIVDPIESVHNYINFEDWIIRKGAISSYAGEKMIISLNMEDGLFVCEGKSNADWNFSAPHGAGRPDSRAWAKKNLSLEDAEHRMKKKGIYCSKLPLDESKYAYKDGKMIKDSLWPTATLLETVLPVLAIKD